MCPRFPLPAHPLRLCCLLFVLLTALKPSASAQFAPATIEAMAGRTLKVTINSATGAFDGVEGSKCHFLPSYDGEDYDIVPVPASSEITPSTGWIQEYHVSGNVATLRLYDTVFDVNAMVTCSFTSATAGTFLLDAGVYGNESGTFTMAAANAPDSIAGTLFKVAITSGGGAYADSGSYWFRPGASGYSIEPDTGPLVASFGSYNYQRVQTYMGSVSYTGDTVVGSGMTSRMSFDTATTGTLTLEHPNGWQWGFQTGTFTMTPNTAPSVGSFSNTGNMTTIEDSPTGAIAFTVSDGQSLAGDVVVSAVSSVPGLVAAFQINRSGNSYSLVVVPGGNQYGSATVTVSATDPGGLTGSRSFTLNVNPVNDAPSISTIAPQTVVAGVVSAPVNFTVGDVETPPASLTVTAASSNTALVPNNALVLGGSGADRTITVTPTAGQGGTATITLTVKDAGNLTATRQFVLTLNAPPVISDIASRSINEDSAQIAIPFTVGDPLTPASALTVTAVSDNQAIIPNASLILGGSGANRTLSLTPIPDASGAAQITVTVNNGSGLTASDAFVLTVNSVNDAPLISTIDPQSLIAGSTSAALPFMVSDIDSPAASLTVSVASSNPAVLPPGGVVFSGTGANRSITVTAAPAIDGFSDIRLTVSDGSASSSSEFRVSVNAVANIPLRSVWKYLAPLTAGAVPANWKLPSYNDAAWAGGPAPLGFSTNGEDGEVTTIPTTGGKPFSVLFRKTFPVTNPAASPWLRCNLRRDDAAIVYLNGVELFRSNLTETGAVAYDTPARISLFGPGETSLISRVVPASALVPGTNVFAVEVHQINAGSSDLGFDMEVIPLTSAPPVISPFDDWKYLSLTAAAVPPASDWKLLSFSDAAWPSGLGVFGFGGDGEVTTLPTASGNPFTSYYRKKFTVSGAAQIKGLRLNLRRDDGAVVYLNGVEKWRSNMPDGVAITHATPARSALGVTNETHRHLRDVTATGLVEGENVIAVEVHQYDASSTDMGFDLGLEAIDYTPDTPPWITEVPDGTAIPGQSSGHVFYVGDETTPARDLVVSATSSRPDLVVPFDMVTGPDGSSRTVGLRVPDRVPSGSAVITLTVSDGINRSTSSFIRTVQAPGSAVKLASWGGNELGQLGNGTVVNSAAPVSVAMPEALMDKTPVQVSAGYFHSLVLFSDASMAAWGANTSGQLGHNAVSFQNAPAAVPVAGVLTGRVVSAVVAGGAFSLALCTDSTIAAWGSGTYGELGTGNVGSSPTPVAVLKTGVLAGKTVTAVAAGRRHALALTSEGRIVSWGANYYGMLGNSSEFESAAPVNVSHTGPLAGKTVAAIAAGEFHSLALCTDGTLAAWGYNYYGQLGNGNNTYSTVPVAVNMSGVLAGRTPVAISAGAEHSLVLCSDGSLVAWGGNIFGQVGDGSFLTRTLPALVTVSPALAGKVPVQIDAGNYSSQAVYADGSIAVWGSTGGNTPALVDLSSVLPGRRAVSVSGGYSFATVLTVPRQPSFHISTLQHLPVGDMLIGFPTRQGVPYDIEYSDALPVWTRWGTVQGTGGELTTRLPNFGSPTGRFFRAVSGP